MVKFQEDVGLQGITDGEFRRTFFHIDFLEQLGGVETHTGFTAQFHTKKGATRTILNERRSGDNDAR